MNVSLSELVLEEHESYDGVLFARRVSNSSLIFKFYCFFT